MTAVILHFFIKLIPHYINIFFGYIAGRYLNVQRESIVGLAFYLFVPVVVFSGTSSLKYSPSLAFLPFIIFLISTVLCLLCYKISQIFWDDNTPNLLGFSAGSANTGYFGLPVAIMLLPPEGVAIYILSFMGIILFEFSVGYYISARGNYTVKQSLKKVAKLPSIYAFALGITLSANGVSIPLPVVEFTDKVKAAYSIMGMMIIGLGLATIKKFEFDFKYMAVSLVSKYVAWPLVIMTLVMLDSGYFMIFESGVHHALILLSLMPLAANNVIFATLFNGNPGKAALAVLISTIMGIIIIPIAYNHLIAIAIPVNPRDASKACFKLFRPHAL